MNQYQLNQHNGLYNLRREVKLLQAEVNNLKNVQGNIVSLVQRRATAALAAINQGKDISHVEDKLHGILAMLSLVSEEN